MSILMGDGRILHTGLYLKTISGRRESKYKIAIKRDKNKISNI